VDFIIPRAENLIKLLKKYKQPVPLFESKVENDFGIET
jgi:hypothetical protein